MGVEDSTLTESRDHPAPASSVTLGAEQMHMVLAVSRLLAVPMELDLLLQHVAEICTDMLGCERASIFLHDAESQQLWTKVAISSAEIRVPQSVGIVGHAFCTNSLVLVSDPYSDPRFNPEMDRRNGFITRNLLTCPMVGVDGNPLGVIQAVNKRCGDFTAQDSPLVQLLAEQSGVAIQRHQLQLAAMETAALQHEMELARQLQQSLIPTVNPAVVGIESVGWMLAASATGGDCFDLWKAPDDRLGIFVGDASGHGLGPAMMVTQVRTLVRALSELETDPHRLLTRVNDRLCEDLTSGRFVTAFFALLSSDGRLEWSSAGHGPVFVRLRPGAALLALDPPAPPLAVVSPWWDEIPQVLEIEPGGSIIIVSDGIFEAVNGKGELLGVPRMKNLIERHRDADPQRLLDVLRDAATNWKGTPQPDDDQTIVIVQRHA